MGLCILSGAGRQTGFPVSRFFPFQVVMWSHSPEPFSLSFLKGLCGSVKKLGLCSWTMTTAKSGISRDPPYTYPLVHGADKTVGAKEQLFPMGHQEAQTANVSLPLRMYFSMAHSIS